MVYVAPGSLQISPASPEVGQAITFSFRIENDFWNYIQGPETTLYLYKRATGMSQWERVSTLDCQRNVLNHMCCEGNDDCLMPFYSPTIYVGTIRGREIKINVPGLYDFLACDATDHASVESGNYTFSRVSTLYSVAIIRGDTPAVCTHGETKCDPATKTTWQCQNGTWVNLGTACTTPCTTGQTRCDTTTKTTWQCQNNTWYNTGAACSGGGTDIIAYLQANPLVALIGIGVLVMLLKPSQPASPMIISGRGG